MIIYRINCGAPKDSTDLDGERWSADQEFAEGKTWGAVGGTAVVRGHAIAEPTRMPMVYHCERYGAMEYRFALPAGKYDLRLHFAETYVGNFVPGARVFSVIVQGKPIAYVDPVSDAAGFGRPYVLAVPGIAIDDEPMSIKLGEGAIINGIEISSHEPTDLEKQFADYVHPSTPDDQFNLAKFRMWAPDAGPLRAIVSLMPGLGGDGRRWTEAPIFQEFARKHRCGLVAGFVRLLESHWPARKRGDSGVPYYWKAGPSGLGVVYETAIRHCANQLHHPELAAAPLLMFGHSAGGKFNFHYTQFRPQRVIAFVADRSMHPDDFTAVNPAACAVPGLFITGETDVAHRDELAYSEYRKSGAPWSIAMERNGDHGMGDDLSLVLPFFESCLRHRLANRSEIPATMPTERLFRGDNKTFEIAKADQPSLTNPAYSIFPDEDFAARWKRWASDPRDPFQMHKGIS